MGPLIRAASLRGFAPLVRELGGDPDRLLARFGISPATLAADDGLVPITEHDLMLDTAAAELDCPDLGLRLADTQDLTILGPLAVAIEASSSVADALQCASRFMFVHSPALSIGLEPDPRGARGVVALAYRKDLAESPYSPQAMELGLGLFHRIAHGMLGSTAGLRTVELPHQPLSPVERYTRFFGVDVRFGAPLAALRVDRRMLERRFEGADETIRRLALEHLARHYPDPSELVSVQVRRALAEGLGLAAPSLGHTARLLALHPRTLQRRLAAEATTFEQVLDDVRRDAARRYLTTTTMPIGQIASLVGFAEQATLSHAVRRWYGVSPRELRSRQSRLDPDRPILSLQDKFTSRHSTHASGMVIQQQSPASTLAEIGARPIPEFDGVHDVWPRGDRLAAVREAAAAYKVRFKEQGQVRAVQSVDIAAAPYPVNYAFHDAVSVPTLPLISMINRMLVVQYDDWNGRARTLVFEPTVPDGSAEAPFYRNLQRLTTKIPGGRLVEKVILKYYNEPGDVLARLGLSPEDIDFCTFDHLHVQDPRMILGSTEVIEGESAPRQPLFGDAKMLVHSRELATLQSLHPMQWAWYVDGGLGGVDPDKFVTFDGDIELGPGVALLWTPGHTDGNHSLVINTPDGVWVSSENGISLDNWQPELSRIPGVRKYHEQFGREVCPNANTLEDSLDQYDSMVKEKTLADPCRDDPRWLQILPSTELAPWKRFWPVVPTYLHGGIEYGEITGGRR